MAAQTKKATTTRAKKTPAKKTPAKKTPAKKTPAKTVAEAQVEARDKNRAGSPSRLRGKVLVKALETNPRRPGRYGWRSWEAHVSGQTFEEFEATLEEIGSDKANGIPGGIKHIRHETDIGRVLALDPTDPEAKKVRKANGLPALDVKAK